MLCLYAALCDARTSVTPFPSCPARPQLNKQKAAADKLKAELDGSKSSAAKAAAEAAAAKKAADDAKRASDAAKKKLADSEKDMANVKSAADRSRSVTAGNRYKINVQTGDKAGAGTDADVSIILIGELGNSQEIDLDNPANNYERNKVRRPPFHCIALPPTCQLIHSHQHPVACSLLVGKLLKRI